LWRVTPRAYPRRIEELNHDQAKVFHAATRPDGSELIVEGGRVLGVTARGADLGEARRRGYAPFDNIDWPQGFCRRDIGRAKGRETVSQAC